MTMTTVDPVDRGQFRAHALNLEVVRELLGEVRIAGRQIGQDQSAYGSLCGWILTGLGDRYTRHEETVAYVEETLRLTADGLHRVADGALELKQMIRREDDVVARDGTPVIENSPQTPTGLLDTIASVQEREWVQPQLAGAAPVAEFVVPADPTYVALREKGLDYALTHVHALRQLIDDLSGTPEVVVRHVAVWRSTGADLHQLSALLQQCLDHDLPRRDRLDVRSYLALMSYNVEALTGLAEIATVMAVITKAAGDLILLTRDIIRGIVGDLFARVIVWTLDISVIATRRVMEVRLGIVVATSWRIRAYATALTDSIITLTRMVDG